VIVIVAGWNAHAPTRPHAARSDHGRTCDTACSFHRPQLGRHHRQADASERRGCPVRWHRSQPSPQRDGSSVANLAVVVPDFATTVLKSLWSIVDWLPTARPLGLFVKPLLKRAKCRRPRRMVPKQRTSSGIETKAYCENLKYKIGRLRFKLRTLHAGPK
jgi:hypothetical protein